MELRGLRLAGSFGNIRTNAAMLAHISFHAFAFVLSGLLVRLA